MAYCTKHARQYLTEQGCPFCLSGSRGGRVMSEICPVCGGEGKTYRMTDSYAAMVGSAGGSSFGWTGPTHEWRTCRACTGAGLLAAPDPLRLDPVWEDVKAEVAAMEAWYAADGFHASVDIFVGWDKNSHWYAGMAVDGDTGEEPAQQEADTPEEALRLFLAVCREYRERTDRERAEEGE